MTCATADTEIIAKAIHLACRAPSLHNSQPWRWIVGEAAVDLFADHERVVRSADRTGREAIISCGAALDHFRIAMAAAGWKTNVDPFPNPSDRDDLASLDFTPAHYVTTAERDRAHAIVSRRTDRLPFHAPSHWESFECYARLLTTARPRSTYSLTTRGRHWPRHPGLRSPFAGTTSITTTNYTGGQTLSVSIRECRPVRWCRRERAKESVSTANSLSRNTGIGASMSRWTKRRYSSCRRPKTPELTRSTAARRCPPSCWSAPWLDWPRAR